MTRKLMLKILINDVIFLCSVKCSLYYRINVICMFKNINIHTLCKIYFETSNIIQFSISIHICILFGFLTYLYESGIAKHHKLNRSCFSVGIISLPSVVRTNFSPISSNTNSNVEGSILESESRLNNTIIINHSNKEL